MYFHAVAIWCLLLGRRQKSHLQKAGMTWDFCDDGEKFYAEAFVIQQIGEYRAQSQRASHTPDKSTRPTERTRQWSMLDAAVLLGFRYATPFLAPLLRPFFMLLRPFLRWAKTDNVAISGSSFITIRCHHLLTRSFQASPEGGEPGALAQRGGDGHQRDVEGDQQHPDGQGGDRHQKHEEALHVI